MYNLVIMALLVVSFFMCVGAYMLGFRHAKQLNNNIVPKVVTMNPIKSTGRAIDRLKQYTEENKVADELADVMSYTRESALHHIKKEATKL